MSAPRSPRRWGPASCASACWRHASSQLRLSLLGAISSLALMPSATAADLSARVVPAPIVAVAPVFTWTGFYAGLNAGWGVSNGHRQLVPSNTVFVRGVPGGALLPIEAEGAEIGEDIEGSRTGGDRDGFVGGGQIGYNYQFTPGSGFVVGVEADLQYARLRPNRRDAFSGFAPLGFGAGPFGNAFTVEETEDAAPGFGVGEGQPGAPGNVILFHNGFANRDRRHDSFGTVRGRIGYAFDRVLFYGTGGLAYGLDNRSSGVISLGSSAIPPGFFVSEEAAAAGATVSPSFVGLSNRNRSNLGYAVGGGIEYALAANVSLKLEALYVNFDRDKDRDVGCCLGPQVVGVTNTGAPVLSDNLAFARRRNEDDFTVLRAGLNVRFPTF